MNYIVDTLITILRAIRDLWNLFWGIKKPKHIMDFSDCLDDPEPTDEAPPNV